MKDAVAQAQANANRSQVCWAVFNDTSGNWRAERYDGSTATGGIIVTPRKPKESA